MQIPQAIPMHENPFEPPQPGPPVLSPMSREAAIDCVRLTVAVLLGPAVYNFICYLWLAGGWYPELAVVQAALLVGTFVLAWRAGVPVLEFATWQLHRLLGRAETARDWQQALYRFLRRLKWAAVPAAALWVIWCYGFYQLRIPFFVISVPIGVVAHLVAACAWLPLLIQWIRIEWNGPADDPPRADAAG